MAQGLQGSHERCEDPQSQHAAPDAADRGNGRLSRLPREVRSACSFGEKAEALSGLALVAQAVRRITAWALSRTALVLGVVVIYLAAAWLIALPAGDLEAKP